MTPTFFGVVTDNDINWLDKNHGTYGATGQTVAHNTRVQQWFQIAKPVISSPNTDLILLPHNRDNSVAYGTVTDFPTLAASGEVQDSVTGTLSPVVNTSVNFKFASVSAGRHRRHQRGTMPARGMAPMPTPTTACPMSRPSTRPAISRGPTRTI